MPFEGMPKENIADEGGGERAEKTPRRLLWLNKKFVETYVPKVHVRGLENLEQIPAGKKVIIVTTHISDFDMPIALKELGERFNVVIADMSSHHHFREDPAGFFTNSAAGMENFIPIDYTSDKGAVFNPENFLAMDKIMKDKRKTVMIAGHNPADGAALPDKGGYGGVYLANLAEDTVILPVAVSLRSDKPMGLASNYLETLKAQPEADLSVGKPINLPKIEEIGRLYEITKKRQSGRKLSPEERAQFAAAAKGLREESAVLMKELAKMLPPERRGQWQE